MFTAGSPLRGNGSTWAGLAAVNVAAVIFGGCALFGKLNVSPLWIVAGRATFAAVTLFALALIRRVSWHQHLDDVTKIAGSGILLALHWLTFFTSVQDSGIAAATLTFATFPLFTTLIDSISRRRFSSSIEVVSGLAIVFAMILLVGRGLPVDAIAQQGAIIGLSSAVLFAAFSIASQKLGMKHNAISLSLHQNVVVALFSFVALPFDVRRPHGVDWAIIAVLGVFATALMHQLYFFSLKRLPAAVCGGFVALEPVYAIIFSAVLFSESVSPVVVFSGALIIGASLLLLSRSKEGVLTS